MSFLKESGWQRKYSRLQSELSEAKKAYENSEQAHERSKFALQKANEDHLVILQNMQVDLQRTKDDLQKAKEYTQTLRQKVSEIPALQQKSSEIPGLQQQIDILTDKLLFERSEKKKLLERAIEDSEKERKEEERQQLRSNDEGLDRNREIQKLKDEIIFANKKNHELEQQLLSKGQISPTKTSDPKLLAKDDPRTWKQSLSSQLDTGPFFLTSSRSSKDLLTNLLFLGRGLARGEADRQHLTHRHLAVQFNHRWKEQCQIVLEGTERY